jgi:hypothetical protein
MTLTLATPEAAATTRVMGPNAKPVPAPAKRTGPGPFTAVGTGYPLQFGADEIEKVINYRGVENSTIMIMMIIMMIIQCSHVYLVYHDCTVFETITSLLVGRKVDPGPALVALYSAPLQ